MGAWRLEFDLDGSMKVGFEEFMIACKTLARQGVAEADPACGVVAAYCALDSARSGWFNLKDWDIESHRHLYAFKTSAEQNNGKASSFIRSRAREANQGVSWPEFRKALR